MAYLKTHMQYSERETLCGKALASQAHAAKTCRVSINDVTCGACLKISLVYKTDHEPTVLRRVEVRPMTLFSQIFGNKQDWQSAPRTTEGLTKFIVANDMHIGFEYLLPAHRVNEVWL